VPCGHAQVGQQLYERVPVYMRTQLWKSLLLHSDSAAKNRPAAAAAAAAAAAEPAAESADVKVFVATINRTLLRRPACAIHSDTRSRDSSSRAQLTRGGVGLRDRCATRRTTTICWSCTSARSCRTRGEPGGREARRRPFSRCVFTHSCAWPRFCLLPPHLLTGYSLAFCSFSHPPDTCHGAWE